MEVFSKLGIDPKIMLAQAVNFFALLAILSFFVYKPILRVLDERKKRIEEADENAKKIEDQLKKTEEDVRAELQKAQKQAKETITHAKKSAKELEDKLVADAKTKVEKVVAEGREQIVRERDEATANIQKEIVKITLLAAEKLLNREITTKDQERFVLEATKEVENLK